MGRTLKFLFLFLILVVIAVVSYYVLNPKKALTLILPSLNEIKNININLKSDSALVKLFVVVQNKMPYKIMMDTLHFEIELDGHKLAKETIPVNIGQSKFGKDTIALPIHLSTKEIKKVIGNLRGQDSTYLTANFYIVYNTFLGTQTLRYNQKIKIATPIPPQIKILKVKQHSYNFRNKTSEATIKLEIINNGKYIDLQLNDIQYNLQIKDKFLSKGVYAHSINVKHSSSLLVDIPVVIKYHKPLKTLWLVARNEDKLEYKLNIKLNVRVNNLENINVIPVELDAIGNIELVK